MRKKVVNSNIAFILALIILIVVGFLIFINLNEKDKYENEGINMTEEEKSIVNDVIKLSEEKIGLEYVWGGKGEIMTDERLDELIGYYGKEYYPLKRET